MNLITQSAIIFCSCGSIFLFSTPGRFRYGFLVGLAGSPFWLYETSRTGQWGMFVVSLWFTFAHLRGIHNNFLRKGITNGL